MLTLYVYDHCPYCVKARMIFALKDVEFNLEFLLNDDEKTPIDMIGKKMVPILELDNGSYMPESMDIVDYIDSNYGDSKIIKPSTNGKIIDWIDSNGGSIYKLSMPRWVKVGLPEFRTESAIEYFTRKKEMYIGSFEAAMAETPDIVKHMNQQLSLLDKLIHSEHYAEEKLSETDIHLFAALRSLSIADGIHFPEKTKKYLHNMSQACEVNTHESMKL